MGETKTYETSRGHLVQAFLESDLLPIRFAQQLEQQQQNFAGFNLFMGNADQAVYMSNRGEAPQVLANGVYVVSNGLMSDHWENQTFTNTVYARVFAYASTPDRRINIATCSVGYSGR